MPAVPIYRSSVGLVTTIDPGRLQISQDTGARAFVRSIDVLVDMDGRMRSRSGLTQVTAGSFHSGWRDPVSGRIYAVSNGALVEAGVDGTTTVIKALSHSDDPMSYVAAMGEVYYSNGRECGRISEGVWASWNTDRQAWNYMAEHLKLDTDRQEWPEVPPGHLITWFNGRMVVAHEEQILFSEVGYPGLFWIHGYRIRLNHRASMLTPVADGMWGSDGQAVYWWGGQDLNQMAQTKVADFGAIPGAVVIEDAAALGLDRVFGLVAVFATRQGICIGGPGGFFQNMTRERIDPDYFRRANSGTAIKAGSHIIFILSFG